MSKKRSREINVFSTSAIDLFASALGVFIILVMILFPYFGKKSEVLAPMPPIQAGSPEVIEDLREQLLEMANLVRDMKKRMAVAEAQTNRIEEQLRSKQLEIATLTEKKNSLQDILDQLETSKGGQSRLQKKFKLALKKLGKLRTTHARAKQAFENLKQKNQQVSQDLATAQQNNAQLQKRNQELFEKLSSKSAASANSAALQAQVGRLKQPVKFASCSAARAE